MHPRGVEEIRAAVVRQAVQDYIDARKIMLALDDTIKSKTAQKKRKSLQIKAKYYCNVKSLTDYRVARRLDQQKADAAAVVRETTAFFLSGAMLMWCDLITGERLKAETDKLLDEWLDGKRRNVSVKSPSHWSAGKRAGRPRKAE